MISRHREKRLANKLALVAYKGGQCVDCERSYPHVCYDFDHRDPFQKGFQIATSYSRPLDELMAEADKCDLVCSNCHRIRTAGSAVVAARLSAGQRGRKHSAESIAKRVAKIKGRHYTIEHRASIGHGKRAANLSGKPKNQHHNVGREPWNKGKTGFTPWNKGLSGVQVAWNRGLSSLNKGAVLKDLETIQ